MPETKTIARDIAGTQWRSHARSRRVRLADGRETTVHVATFPRHRTAVRVAVFPDAQRLVDWCKRTGTRHALTGGFFSRRTGRPLGRVWMRGVAVETDPFGKQWADSRGAIHAVGGTVRIAPLHELPHYPVGDLVTAGPLLVREGRSLINEAHHFEGIPETWENELDDDWTRIRAQRTALGLDRSRIWAVACDGPTTNAPAGGPGDTADEAGIDLAELAQLLLMLGAEEGLNLDGGGGTTLVHDQRLINRPRAGAHDEGYDVGEPMRTGRPIHTALTFLDK